MRIPNSPFRSSNFRLAAALAILLAAASARVRAQAPDSLGCALEAGPERAVAAVMDGETIRLDDGKEVRLAGALAPRASDVGAARGSWPAEVQSTEALRALAHGRTVALAFSGRREDRHGRLLAQVFVRENGQSTWLQGEMLQQGMARAFLGPDTGGCIDALLRQERGARLASRGLWSNAAYDVRPGDRPSELQRFRGTFQLVRGRIAKIGRGQSLATLDLASAEATADSADDRASGTFIRAVRVLWRRSLKLDLPSGRNDLVDRDILVRGWIETRGGIAEIEVVAAGQIEWIGGEGSEPKNETPGTGPGAR